MDIRPSACVVGRMYLLHTKRGWEEVIFLGHIDEDELEFRFVRHGIFGTKLFSFERVTVSNWGDNLRTSEPVVQNVK